MRVGDEHVEEHVMTLDLGLPAGRVSAGEELAGGVDHRCIKAAQRSERLAVEHDERFAALALDGRGQSDRRAVGERRPERRRDGPGVLGDDGDRAAAAEPGATRPSVVDRQVQGFDCTEAGEEPPRGIGDGIRHGAADELAGGVAGLVEGEQLAGGGRPDTSHFGDTGERRLPTLRLPARHGAPDIRGVNCKSIRRRG